jgi:hypothetical protein
MLRVGSPARPSDRNDAPGPTQRRGNFTVKPTFLHRFHFRRRTSMLAIRNTVQRVFAMATLLTIKNALLCICRKQPSQPIQQREAVTDIGPTGGLYAIDDDPEETFADWEADRNEKLYQVQEYEQRGLDLLGKAALLRAALKCDDRGETFIAEEIREQAEAIGSKSITEVPSDTRECPILHAVAAGAVATNDLPAQPAA